MCQFVQRMWMWVFAFVALTGCSKESLSFKSVDITGANYAQAFALRDAQGQVRQLTDFKGKAVVIFFGYTQCPDVCPTTLTEMVKLKQALGDQGQRLAVVFITLDPARATPEVLKAYMQSFDPGFVALIPTLEELPDLAKRFKVYYRQQPGRTPTSYTLDHFAGSYVYDPEGRLRLFVRYGMPPEDLAGDIKQLLKR